MQVPAMTRCELHGAGMIQDRRYTTIGVFRCPRGCEIQDPGYDETRLCGLTGCKRVLNPDSSHPYQLVLFPPAPLTPLAAPSKIGAGHGGHADASRGGPDPGGAMMLLTFRPESLAKIRQGRRTDGGPTGSGPEKRRRAPSWTSST